MERDTTIKENLRNAEPKLPKEEKYWPWEKEYKAVLFVYLLNKEYGLLNVILDLFDL